MTDLQSYRDPYPKGPRCSAGSSVAACVGEGTFRPSTWLHVRLRTHGFRLHTPSLSVIVNGETCCVAASIHNSLCLLGSCCGSLNTVHACCVHHAAISPSCSHPAPPRKKTYSHFEPTFSERNRIPFQRLCANAGDGGDADRGNFSGLALRHGHDPGESLAGAPVPSLQPLPTHGQSAP